MVLERLYRGIEEVIGIKLERYLQGEVKNESLEKFTNTSFSYEFM